MKVLLAAFRWYEIAAYLFVLLLYVIFFIWATKEYRRLRKDEEKHEV